MVDFHLYVDWADFEWCESLTNDYLESVRKRYRHHIAEPLAFVRKRYRRHVADHLERGTYAESVFRKLCILQQKEYEEIIYLDIDSVVLKNLQPLFNFLKCYDIGFGSQSTMEGTYNVRSDPTQVLGRDIPYYNTGMILLKKELFSRETIDETMKFGDENDLFAEHGYDQTVLNLVTMRTGVKHVDMRSAIWANDKFEVKNGEVIEKPESYVVHWAGSKMDVAHKELIRRFDPTFDHWIT
jgi:lipopolysaccharide biosynthesis glycosyltransferase